MTDVQKSVETAVGSVAEKAAAASKEQLAKQIDLLKQEFDRQQKEIGEKAGTLTGEAQGKLRDALSELELKQGELTKKWEAFSKEGGKAATELASGLAKAISDMRDALSKASTAYRQAEEAEALEAKEPAAETEATEAAPKPQ